MKTDSTCDISQKTCADWLTRLAAERCILLLGMEEKFLKKEITLDDFNKYKKDSYIFLKNNLESLLDFHIKHNKYHSPELVNLLNKKSNHEESDFEYLEKLEENNFVNVPALMDTKVLVDHFKKIDLQWNPENKIFLFKNLDLISDSIYKKEESVTLEYPQEINDTNEMEEDFSR